MPTKSRKNEAKWYEKYQYWQIQVQCDGIRKPFYSKIPGKKGKADCEKQADKWLDSGANKDNIRFGQLWQNYIDSIDTGHSTANKIKMEQIGRVWLLPRWEHKKVSSLTNRNYQDAIDAVVDKPKPNGKPRSKRTCGHVRSAIMAAYSYAKSDRTEMEYPFKLKIPKAAIKGERKILLPEDLKKLFSIDYIYHYGKQKPTPYIYAWRFMATAGLRRGEVCGLQRGDIKDGIIYIKRSITDKGEITKGKNDNALRYFVLNTHALKVLSDQEQMLKRKGVISKWLFPDVDNNGIMLNPCKLYDRWDTFRKQHEMTLSSLHEIRHTMISIAKADIPEELIKQIVGHSENMDTYDIYGHKVKGDLTRTAKLLDDVLAPYLCCDNAPQKQK